MTSLKTIYQEECKKMEVKKVNSAVLAGLPADAAGFTEWDLSGNVVGTRGATAVLRVVEHHMPDLETLNLSGNNLTSPITKEVLLRLANHPSLTSINLSDNDIRLGGPELIELLKKNKRITNLNIENTFLRPLFTRLIAIQIKKNGGAPVASSSGGSAIRFSFGQPDPQAEGDEAFAAAEDDAFSAFKVVGFDSGAEKNAGKKVPRRATVCSEVYREDEIDAYEPEVHEKDDALSNWLMSVVERHDLFSHLEDFELKITVDAMYEAQRAKGENLFEEGDEGGDLFFVIIKGEVSLTANGEVVKTLKRGDTTQDLMLLYSDVTRETATCLTDVQYCTLDRQTYRCVLSKASKKKRAMYEGFLNTVGFLKAAELTKTELLQLADSLKPAVYESGASLIHYGEVGETFYIIVEGVVEVFGRDDEKNVIKVCEFTVGDCVGELEFINNHKCVADVKAKNSVRVAKMNRHHFEMVMGPVMGVLARNASESTVYEYYRAKLEQMDKEEVEKAEAEAEKKEE